MRHESITTPGVSHDPANAITELIVLNNDLLTGEYPWKQGRKHQSLWTKTVAAVKRLMSPTYGISADQLAFYVHRCRPKEIDSKEFAKMAVVAKKLLLRMNLQQLVEAYRTRRRQLQPTATEKMQYRCEVIEGPKTLVELIRELERDGEKDEEESGIRQRT